MFDIIPSAFAILLVTVGPWEVSSIYLALTQGWDDAARRKTAILAACIGAGILFAFALAGTPLLKLLGIGLPAFRTAGGFLLLKLSADLLLTHHSELSSISVSEEREAQRRSGLAVFPLGIPMIAGPGSITGVMLLVSHARSAGDQAGILVVIALVSALTFLSMLAAERISRILGVTGGNVIARVSGILLAALAMQFVFDGLSESGIFR